jgi:hypothetical protein
LFNGAAYSGGLLEVLGNFGFSITLIVLFMVLLARLRWLRVVLTPLIAVGGMTLTAYVIEGIALGWHSSEDHVAVLAAVRAERPAPASPA